MDNSYNGHIKFKETLDGMELRIPADKNRFLVVVFTPFILIWLFVEVFVFPSFISNGSMPLAWFCGWTACGVLAIRMWLWHTVGQTKIFIQNNMLTIRKQNDLFAKQKNFNLNKIQNLHIQNRDIEKTQFFTRRNYLFTDKLKLLLLCTSIKQSEQ